MEDEGRDESLGEPMKVAFDTNSLYVAHAGIARYARGLLQGLRGLAAPDLDLAEFAWEAENYDYRQPRRALRTFYRELVWATFVAPARLRRMQADLHHTVGSFLFRPPSPVRCVVSLCDLAVMRRPERFRPWHRTSEQRRLRRLHQAERIICISHFTASEAMALLGIPSRRLVVTHLGSSLVASPPQAQTLPPDLQVPGEFFLFVGSLEPGKNLSLLRQAYELAHQEGAPLPPLVIVGARWQGVRGEGPPPANWHYLGRQPDAVLIQLYRRAIALVFPSVYEGFGFPVLEAMALDCPVVCSRVASLPEVGGEAVRYADLDPRSYAEAMRSLSRDGTLRDGLVAAGQAQARKFSWSRCAEETRQVYRDVVSGK